MNITIRDHKFKVNESIKLKITIRRTNWKKKNWEDHKFKEGKLEKLDFVKNFKLGKTRLDFVKNFKL